VITIETRPVRLAALQWHQPGDAAELGVRPYRFASEVRYGLHSMNVMQRVTAGDWIVLGANGTAQVYSLGEFNHKFKIIEEVSHESVH
jgi:hypothetical protein